MSVWGPEAALTLYSIRYPFRVYQTRQQITPGNGFTLDGFNEFRRSGLASNGSTIRMLENSLASFFRKATDPYDLIESKVTHSAASAQMCHVITLSGRAEKRNKHSHYAALALTTAAASVLVHPFAIMGTWQSVQNIACHGVTLSFSAITNQIHDAKRTYSDIANSKKSFYDGLPATIVSNVSFEVFKFYLSDQLHNYFHFHSIDEEIRNLHTMLGAKVHVDVRTDNRRRYVIMRWDRLALSGLLTYSSSVLAELLVYPLRTIALKLQAQGASPSLPIQYNNGIDCTLRIIRDEGVLSLYAGVTSLIFSLFPEIFAAGCTYYAVRCAIDAVSDETRHQFIEPILNTFEGGVFEK